MMPLFFVVLSLLTAGIASASAADDWKNVFLTGKPFISATPQNVQYRMVLTPDGKITRTPIGAAGVMGEGNWAVSDGQICTAWAGTPPNCFNLVQKDEKQWAVMKGTAQVGLWTVDNNASKQAVS